MKRVKEKPMHLPKKRKSDEKGKRKAYALPGKEKM